MQMIWENMVQVKLDDFLVAVICQSLDRKVGIAQEEERASPNPYPAHSLALENLGWLA